MAAYRASQFSAGNTRDTNFADESAITLPGIGFNVEVPYTENLNNIAESDPSGALFPCMT